MIAAHGRDTTRGSVEVLRQPQPRPFSEVSFSGIHQSQLQNNQSTYQTWLKFLDIAWVHFNGGQCD